MGQRKRKPTRNFKGGGRRPGGRSCPDPIMLILMADGSQKEAGNLKVGDLVKTYHEKDLKEEAKLARKKSLVLASGDVEKHSQLREQLENSYAKATLGEYEVEFVEIVKDVEKIKLSFEGSEIICSLTHKFYVNNSWKEAKDMVIGDEVSGKKLLSTQDVENGDVVHITIKDAHTYICEGLLSHNKRVYTGPRPPKPDLTRKERIRLRNQRNKRKKRRMAGEKGNLTEKKKEAALLADLLRKQKIREQKAKRKGPARDDKGRPLVGIDRDGNPTGINPDLKRQLGGKGSEKLISKRDRGVTQRTDDSGMLDGRVRPVSPRRVVVRRRVNPNQPEREVPMPVERRMPIRDFTPRGPAPFDPRKEVRRGVRDLRREKAITTRSVADERRAMEREENRAIKESRRDDRRLQNNIMNRGLIF
jgi:hypothetical protein